MARWAPSSQSVPLHSQHFRGLNLVQASLTFDYSVAGALLSGPFAMEASARHVLAVIGFLRRWFS